MADIQLSSELFQDIQQAVLRQDPEADQGIVMQYLAAVMGYMLGSQRDMSTADLSQRQQQQSSPPAGQAFGYWEPPK